MNTKQTIRKVIIVATWLAIGGGMITLLAAAMRQQKSDRCSNYIITVKGVKENLFVQKKDVFKVLSAATKGNVKGQLRSAFDLMKMEQQLEKNVWVKDAELYFDNKDVLHVRVTEREPVARIFAITGKTWYIDKDEVQLPLADNVSADVPVFTGFPVKKVVSKRDKELMHVIRLIAEYINADPFWKAQVAQVDITAERELEMIPVVGNHIVKLGKPEDMEIKFNRLFTFYKQVLSKSGFDKYQSIDVQYAGQVIGVKGKVTKVDSVQLRRNVEKLLLLARSLQQDTLVPVAPVIARPSAEAATVNAGENSSIVPYSNSATTTERIINPNPVKTPSSPKAVMPKRE